MGEIRHNEPPSKVREIERIGVAYGNFFLDRLLSKRTH